ncbi:MAG: hypothetical protein M0P59_03825 [Gallionella sp.]|jgi:hypothetical protein|nr:hypothetical protein [Gallionella sp.]MCK9353268.1 hypothetical protein [Gallionella sp.]
MQKLDERQQLHRVFWPRSLNARDFERPDFLIDGHANHILGIEVTSFYASNADAKLKHLPGYAGALIDGTRRPHLADTDQLRVEEVTLLNQDESVFDKITGIIQEVPSPETRIELLFSKISEKEQKTEGYLRNCDEVDLVIYDASHLFHHESHEQFYRSLHPLAPKLNLVASRFREIHMITSAADRNSVYIPLIANTFIADCFAYEHLLASEIKAGRSSREVFQLLAACLWQEGYSRARVTSSNQGVGFSCGAWEIFYAEDGKKIRDWNFPDSTYGGEPLTDAISDASTEVLELAQSLLASRNTCFSAVDVRLPTHEPSPRRMG